MPHDKNGQAINVGDRVNVACVVKDVQAGADYCNLSVETVEKMHPGEYTTTITLNTRQVEVSGGGAASFAGVDPVETFRAVLKRVKELAATGADGVEAGCTLLDEISRAGRGIAQQMREFGTLDANRRREIERLRDDFAEAAGHAETATTPHTSAAAAGAVDWRKVLANVARLLLEQLLKG